MKTATWERIKKYTELQGTSETRTDTLVLEWVSQSKSQKQLKKE